VLDGSLRVLDGRKAGRATDRNVRAPRSPTIRHAEVTVTLVWNVSTRRGALDSATADLGLTPREVAEREVTSLGPDEASIRWADLVNKEPFDRRIRDIADAVIALCYASAPPPDDRCLYVISTVDSQSSVQQDILVRHAPTPIIAMMGGKIIVRQRGESFRGYDGFVRVLRVDHSVSIGDADIFRDGYADDE
jgi:hypothetical protein